MTEPAAFPNLSLDETRFSVEAQALDEPILLESLDDVRDRAHARLLRDLDLAEVKRLPEGGRRAALLPVVRRVLDEGFRLHRAERDRLAEELLDDLLGLGPLEALLRD